MAKGVELVTALHTLLHTLACSVDLARPLAREAVDVAIDRGLALLADRRPWRVVARPDYILRYYLGGRLGHAFPEDTPTVLGRLGGTAYLHRIGSPDSGRAHHSHPWEWAISVVLAGGYTEEVVGADGSITTRQRLPGSTALISATSFHRIAEIHAPRVWTLFVVGPRTPDRAWYFRRIDGSIVHEKDYHANLEAERAAEEAWVAERDAEMGPAPGDFVRSGDDECIATRVTDGEVWGNWVGKYGYGAQRVSATDVEIVARAGTPLAREAAARLPPPFGEPSVEPAAPTPPKGYTFEQPGPSPMVIVRHGDSYVGSLMSNGTAVAHGAQIKPAELARHADAWAHARAMRGAS